MSSHLQTLESIEKSGVYWPAESQAKYTDIFMNNAVRITAVDILKLRNTVNNHVDAVKYYNTNHFIERSILYMSKQWLSNWIRPEPFDHVYDIFGS